MPKLNVVAGIIDKVADKIDELHLIKQKKHNLYKRLTKHKLKSIKLKPIAIAYLFQDGDLLWDGLVE